MNTKFIDNILIILIEDILLYISICFQLTGSPYKLEMNSWTKSKFIKIKKMVWNLKKKSLYKKL